MKVKTLSRVRLFATPWSAAYQAPPSMGFSRQEYWSGVPLPSPDSVCNCPLTTSYPGTFREHRKVKKPVRSFPVAALTSPQHCSLEYCKTAKLSSNFTKSFIPSLSSHFTKSFIPSFLRRMQGSGGPVLTSLVSSLAPPPPPPSHLFKTCH